MQSRVIVDTGPIVAQLDRTDSFHVVCKQQFFLLPPPTFTTWAVLTEVAWLVRGAPNAFSKMLELLEVGALVCLELDAGFPTWCREFCNRYSDLKPQLADASLVYLAESFETRTIFTLDRRDFAVFRTRKGEPFILLPERLNA